jgi:hypothetical protein
VVLLICRMIPRMVDFGDEWPTLGATESVSVLGLIVVSREAHNTDILQFLVCFDRYKLYLVPCEIWRWVIHLSFENSGNSAQKFTPGNRKVSKKVKCVSQTAHRLYFTSRLFQTLVISESGSNGMSIIVRPFWSYRPIFYDTPSRRTMPRPLGWSDEKKKFSKANRKPESGHFNSAIYLYAGV